MTHKQLGQIYYKSLSSTKKEMLKQTFIEKKGSDSRIDNTLLYLCIFETRIKFK